MEDATAPTFHVDPNFAPCSMSSRECTAGSSSSGSSELQVFIHDIEGAEGVGTLGNAYAGSHLAGNVIGIDPNLLPGGRTNTQLSALAQRVGSYNTAEFDAKASWTQVQHPKNAPSVLFPECYEDQCAVTQSGADISTVKYGTHSEVVSAGPKASLTGRTAARICALCEARAGGVLPHRLRRRPFHSMPRVDHT